MSKSTLRAAWAFFAIVLLCSPSRLPGADADVVINEIMYHPPLELDELQYIELFNRGETTVDLSKWSIQKGVTFEFPAKTELAGGAYLVICRNAAAFGAHYGKDLTLAGEFKGKLSHHGEKVELCDSQGHIIDEVKYSDARPWPSGPDGHSASLERICPYTSGKEIGNWAGSRLPPMEKPAGTPGRKNENFATNLPPLISQVRFPDIHPRQRTRVTAEVSAGKGVKEVTLLWWTARTGSQTQEAEVPMQRVSGDEKKGVYQAEIPGAPENSLVRFRLRATDPSGTVRYEPSPNEPCPTYSYSTFLNTNSARIGFAYVINIWQGQSRARSKLSTPQRPLMASATRGNAAFIYVPPDGGEVETFDHVLYRRRNGGFKVTFGKEHPFKGMTKVNLIFENSARWVLAEPMAYELYRLAGVPACLTEHVRTWLDGRPVGYQLLLDQPNRAFLSRNQRDQDGNMYKLRWMGQGLTGQHVKKNHFASGHTDLVALHRGLTQLTGAAQWEFIQKNFNVDEFINYYAVNMCIQNWDGFFNNYWLYHDTARGKWEIYPWDEDKTWGDYDGASQKFDWYEMPLTFGMTGDPVVGGGPFSRNFFGGPFGGTTWWRPPGWFSGPLLANPQFRKLFLARLTEICRTVFTDEKMIPLINAMEKRLEPEIPFRAQLTGDDPREAAHRFQNDIQSLRNQVTNRRKFILSEIPKDRASH